MFGQLTKQHITRLTAVAGIVAGAGIAAGASPVAATPTVDHDVDLDVNLDQHAPETAATADIDLGVDGSTSVDSIDEAEADVAVDLPVVVDVADPDDGLVTATVEPEADVHVAVAGDASGAQADLQIVGGSVASASNDAVVELDGAADGVLDLRVGDDTVVGETISFTHGDRSGDHPGDTVVHAGQTDVSESGAVSVGDTAQLDHTADVHCLSSVVLSAAAAQCWGDVEIGIRSDFLDADVDAEICEISVAVRTEIDERTCRTNGDAGDDGDDGGPGDGDDGGPGDGDDGGDSDDGSDGDGGSGTAVGGSGAGDPGDGSGAGTAVDGDITATPTGITSPLMTSEVDTELGSLPLTGGSVFLLLMLGGGLVAGGVATRTVGVTRPSQGDS